MYIIYLSIYLYIYIYIYGGVYFVGLHDLGPLTKAGPQVHLADVEQVSQPGGAVTGRAPSEHTPANKLATTDSETVHELQPHVM